MFRGASRGHAPAKPKEKNKGKFDRTAYRREYMGKRRAKAIEARETALTI
jgi:hypothetical protein